MDDDDLPTKQPQLNIGAGLGRQDLAPLGVAELNAYIDQLKGEIARVEAAIAAKLGQRAGAEAFFKK
jgi:uncharacterized small protein (DUF1192 family)